MSKGFTIIELLVASLLLGMLVTILTMVFNQSSISWRIGVASVADMDGMRDNIAELREEADNAFIAKEGGSYKVFRHIGLWQSDGKLRNRSCDASELTDGKADSLHANILQKGDALGNSFADAEQAADKVKNSPVVRVGQAGSDDTLNNYTVNVMSAGPDREFDTWDDIWSWPDDFE